MAAKFSQVSVLGVPFLNTTASQFVAHVIATNDRKQAQFIVTANPEIVLAAHQDPAFMQLIHQADSVVADGIGVILGAKILRTPLPERVTGFDTMTALLQHASDQHKKVYLLGAKPEVITKTVATINQRYPNCEIVGAHDGYFTADEAPAIGQEICASDPDFVFVALGAPKQEQFIAQYYRQTHAAWMGVGGSFDVLAGVVQRAPKKWQELHLEWLYRLLKQPSRITRMMALPHYLALVVRQRFQRK